MLCPHCGSSGLIQKGIFCDYCSGTGRQSRLIDQGFERSPTTAQVICDKCRGSGKRPVTEACQTCKGTGQVVERFGTYDCPNCRGSGFIRQERGKYPSGLTRFVQLTCPTCGGRGKVQGRMLVPDWSWVSFRRRRRNLNTHNRTRFLTLSTNRWPIDGTSLWIGTTRTTRYWVQAAALSARWASSPPPQPLPRPVWVQRFLPASGFFRRDRRGAQEGQYRRD